MSDEAQPNSAQLETLARDHFDLHPTAPVRQLSAGNINRSAVVEVGEERFILQELNEAIFTNPDALMANSVAILQRMAEANLSTMTLRPTRHGGYLARIDGFTWRCYQYLDGEAHAAINDPDEAQSTARAFGRYAEAITGLDLVEHLPGYHAFDARVAELERQIDADVHGRGPASADVIRDVLNAVDQLRLSGSYQAWLEVPVRNAHNDAKAPNCVISERGGHTVIDLDTTMPGTIIADIGELVRSATRALDDDSPEVVMAQIEAVNRGFLAGYRQDLTAAEHGCMLLAGPLMTTENAVRFLSDHLAGDTYYRVAEPNHNLRRAAAQLRLAESQIAAIEHATFG